MTHNEPLESIGYEIKFIGSEFWQFTNYLISRIISFQHNFIGKLDAKSVHGYQVRIRQDRG